LFVVALNHLCDEVGCEIGYVASKRLDASRVLQIVLAAADI